MFLRLRIILLFLLYLLVMRILRLSLFLCLFLLSLLSSTPCLFNLSLLSNLCIPLPRPVYLHLLPDITWYTGILRCNSIHLKVWFRLHNRTPRHQGHLPTMSMVMGTRLGR